MRIGEETIVDEPVVAAPAATEDDDWDNIPTASREDFFSTEPTAATDAPAAPADPAAPSTDAPAPAAPAANAEDDDDFWSDEPANPAAPAVSKGLRNLIAEKYGVTVSETDGDEAVLNSLVSKIQSAVSQSVDPIAELDTRLGMDKRALVKQRLMDEFKAGESVYETEDDIEDELDKWTENGALERKYNSEVRRLNAEKTNIEATRAAQEAAHKVEFEKQRQEFTAALESFEFEGVKFPAKQIPIIKDYVESFKYSRQMSLGILPDGTQMSPADLAKQVIFAHPVFRDKFIAKSNEKAAQKAVSDYIKGLENRSRPTETGGYVAPKEGIETVGHATFFGKN